MFHVPGWKLIFVTRNAWRERTELPSDLRLPLSLSLPLWPV